MLELPLIRQPPRVDTRMRRGEAGFTRVAVAMFAAGAAIFALLYSPQAVLPQLSTTFHVTPAGAGLAMSTATAALALAVIPASALSERWGRARVLVASVALAALLGVLLPLSPSYAALLGIRALQGLAMAGMPAVAMAYLADEIHPSALAGAVGTFIAGNGLGGLTGRMVAGVATDLGGWRLGLAAVSMLSVCCAVAFIVLLPAQRHGSVGRSGGRLGGALRQHLGDPGLRRLYLAGFVLMGGFVTIYNYLGYRLLRAPFALSPALVGLIFLAYLAGTVASAVAGRLADRHGARVVLAGSVLLAIVATLCTLPDSLPAVLAGLVLVTAGFFAAHAVASGRVSGLAATARGQAAGLYLFAYYAGSSLGGWVGGLVFERAGWTGTAAYVVAMFAIALTPTLRRTLPR
jgi:YNFM family putative membrane transporter